MGLSVPGVGIPDSKLAGEITEFVRDTASPLLFHHSSRVYYFGALAGLHRGLSFDPDFCMPERCSMTWDLPRVMGALMSASKWTAQMQPAISSAITTSLRRMSTRYGRQSLCTRHPAFRDTCILSLPWLRQASRWMCLA
jgi:hypothetical protein